ncbi:MAG: hypothetical protein U1E49_05880 [Hyphomicrobiaceae bacterium]
MGFFARKSEPLAEARPVHQQHVGADPLSVALPALGALGTIASLASITWSVATAEPGVLVGRKPSRLIRDMETDCLVVLEALRKLNRFLRENGGAKTLAATPFKFGLLGSPVARDAQALYRTLMSDVGRVGVSAHANVLDILVAVHTGQIDAPEEAFYGFGECQERLNGLLAERRGLSAVIDGGVAVAEALTRHVAHLKSFARA